VSEHTNDKIEIKHALRYSFLNRFYDAVTSLTCREKYFKTEMIKLADTSENGPVVDIACGTGTFIGMYRKVHPDARIIGIDADQNILEIARHKTRDLDSIEYVCSYSNGINLEDESAGAVYTGLFYHHLDYKNKLDTSKEALRILKKNGKYVICDWGRPSNIFTQIGFFMVRILDGFDTTLDNYQGKIPGILSQAGFQNVIEHKSIDTVFGTLRIWSGEK
jgi:ubiquinone/menaquinone biosynthesis C-methylase UbiE